VFVQQGMLNALLLLLLFFKTMWISDQEPSGNKKYTYYDGMLLVLGSRGFISDY
jgi:hypothetical protein